jgi:hypothetical protein
MIALDGIEEASNQPCSSQHPLGLEKLLHANLAVPKIEDDSTLCSVMFSN